MVQICWTIAHVFICIAQSSHEVKSYQDALHVQWNQIWGAIREFFPPSLGKPECFAVRRVSVEPWLNKPEAGGSWLKPPWYSLVSWLDLLPQSIVGGSLVRVDSEEEGESQRGETGDVSFRGCCHNCAMSRKWCGVEERFCPASCGDTVGLYVNWV